MMETKDAIAAFAAIAQDTRLSALRLLIAEGPEGLAAGAIAERLAVPQSTLSFHLSQLERAGLVRSTRQARHIIYAADFEGVRGLVQFLTEDCCRGHPELCGTGLSLTAKAPATPETTPAE
ncbi:MAG: metalloregulator ArsR/SmtB family transcription factor [Azospirillaceae bacterium]